MNRRDYWNRDYADYWKKVTDEAEAGEGRDSRVEKLSGHDFKAPGIKESTSFFDKIKYDKTDKILDYFSLKILLDLSHQSPQLSS